MNLTTIKARSTALNRFHIVVFTVLFASGCTLGTNTDKFVELTHEDFEQVIVGNTIVHRLAGIDRREYFDPDGTIDGHESVQNYNGRWTLGDDNCVVVTVSDLPTRCWVFLHDTRDDVHYIGTRDKDKYVSVKRLEILSGHALSP